MDGAPVQSISTRITEILGLFDSSVSLTPRIHGDCMQLESDAQESTRLQYALREHLWGIMLIQDLGVENQPSTDWYKNEAERCVDDFRHATFRYLPQAYGTTNRDESRNLQVFLGYL